MEWFRRKSLAKETLSGLKTAGLKSDSASSFVKVGESPAKSMRSRQQAAGAGASEADLQAAAMSSTSTLNREEEEVPGPTINVSEDAAPVPDSATLPKDLAQVQSQGQSSTDKTKNAESSARVPLGSAASKTNIPSTSNNGLLSPQRSSHGPQPVPVRSKSLLRESSTPSSPATPQMTQSAILPPKPSTRSTGVSSTPQRVDDRMRVHTGLVDQSALSSKPPREVIQEVLKVLQEMGMEIKKENEYRLRCTRARKRKTGATTGLGLGSVMSVGSGMGPFNLMGSASSSRVSLQHHLHTFALTQQQTDSRGLPMPPTSSSGGISGGLKGMLLRRGSSYSSQHPGAMSRSESDIMNSPSASTVGFGLPILGGSPATQHEPLYGEHS